MAGTAHIVQPYELHQVSELGAAHEQDVCMQLNSATCYPANRFVGYAKLFGQRTEAFPLGAFFNRVALIRRDLAPTLGTGICWGRGCGYDGDGRRSRYDGKEAWQRRW